MLTRVGDRLLAIWWLFIVWLAHFANEPRMALRHMILMMAVSMPLILVGIFLPGFWRTILYVAVQLYAAAMTMPIMARSYQLFRLNPPDPRPFVIRGSALYAFMVFIIGVNIIIGWRYL